MRVVPCWQAVSSMTAQEVTVAGKMEAAGRATGAPKRATEPVEVTAASSSQPATPPLTRTATTQAVSDLCMAPSPNLVWGERSPFDDELLETTPYGETEKVFLVQVPLFTYGFGSSHGWDSRRR